MITGIVFYGFIIASVAAGLANADAQRARYQERLNAIKSFLKVKNNKTSDSNHLYLVIPRRVTCNQISSKNQLPKICAAESSHYINVLT